MAANPLQPLPPLALPAHGLGAPSPFPQRAAVPPPTWKRQHVVLRRLWEAGVPLDEICDRLLRPRSQVLAKAARMGLCQPRHSPAPRGWRRALRADLAWLAQDVRSSAEVATRWGCTPRRASQRLQRLADLGVVEAVPDPQQQEALWRAIPGTRLPRRPSGPSGQPRRLDETASHTQHVHLERYRRRVGRVWGEALTWQELCALAGWPGRALDGALERLARPVSPSRWATLRALERELNGIREALPGTLSSTPLRSVGEVAELFGAQVPDAIARARALCQRLPPRPAPP